MDVGCWDAGEPARNQLGPCGIRSIDGIILAGIRRRTRRPETQIAAVIGQSVGCPGAFMADDGLHHAAAVAPRAHRERGEQLREAAIARNIIDVDLRTTPAVLAIVCTEQLAPFVDLQRLPRIEHRYGLQMTGRRRRARIRDVDHRYAEVCRIAGRRAAGRRGRAVIGANASVPVPELGRLPVRAIAFALPDELEIAIESLEAGGAQRRGHLALQARFGMIVGTARGLRYGQWNRALIRPPVTTIGGSR